MVGMQDGTFLSLSGASNGWWTGHSEMIGQHGARVSLAWVPVPWPRHTFEETVTTQRTGHQSVGSDCQAAQHSLRTCQELEGQACGGSQDDPSHRSFKGSQDEHGTDGQKIHASQSAIAIVIVFH